MEAPHARTAREMVAAFRRGELSPERVVESASAAHARWESGPRPLNAFLAADWAAAHHQAGLAARDPSRPLAGVPVALKDNLCTTDFPTTCGSELLEEYRSPFDATVVRRLREAGALVVGKTNMDEFAMGSSTEHSAFGPTRNPRDLDRVPGGSSGGAAAAVAAGIVPLAVGSDTGGSVRQPAAFCGIVGVKPTYGAVSRHGLVALASSLDHVGVMARTVGDAALALAQLAGADALDATSAAPPPESPSTGREGLAGLVVGVPAEYFPDSLHAGVRDACRAALRRLEGAGAEIREISLPHTPVAVPAYHVLANAEASSNLARVDGARFGRRAADAATPAELYERTRALFGPEVKRRLILGGWLLAAGHYDDYYLQAQRVRALVARDFAWAFRSGVDVLFTPTTPAPAFRLGEVGDPYEMYLADVFTVGANLAGLPALSLPVGRADGLPVGAQLIGPAWSEPVLLGAAAALESALAPGGGPA